MKIALDGRALRTTPLLDLPARVAGLGYSHVELSPREDFLPADGEPVATPATVAAFKRALDAAGVQVAAVRARYRWAGPDPDERRAAIVNWRRAIEITVDLGCSVMSSRFGGHDEQQLSEAGFQQSISDLLPVLGRQGVQVRLEPHPDDFVPEVLSAVDIIRGINSPQVSFLYRAPRAFHQRGKMIEVMRVAGQLMTHVRLVDSVADWHYFFLALDALGFGRRDTTILTARVTAKEDRVDEACRFMRSEIDRHVSRWARPDGAGV